ncbi:MAG: metalloregulator ArsR/SmtB family transcription factor [Hyphomicrobiales bacterium]
METLLKSLKAVAESTRIRILAILAEGECNVTELTAILSQSQPRVSRHLKLLVDADLVERHKEGNWVLFRLTRQAGLVVDILKHVPQDDPLIARDREKLNMIKTRRSEAAEKYFSKVAASWSVLRSLNVDDRAVEVALKKMIGPASVDTLVDLGTGTGRMLELFAPQARQAIGVDRNREMLAFARVAIEKHGLTNTQVRLADVNDVPLKERSADLVIIHQVLHYLDNPLDTIREAHRLLRPGGRLVVVDLAPHDREFLREEHAHRRLGIATDTMRRWMESAGLSLVRRESLKPAAQDGLDVDVWMAERPRDAVLKEVRHG